MSLCPHGYTANWDCPHCECVWCDRTAENCVCHLDPRPEYHGAAWRLPVPESCGSALGLDHEKALPYVDIVRCMCVTCCIARRHDKRDAYLMLRAERLRCAKVTPAQRLAWDSYIAERTERGEYLPDAARRV